MTNLEKLNLLLKAHQASPPWPGTHFDEQKHRWIADKENNDNSLIAIDSLKQLRSWKQNTNHKITFGGIMINRDGKILLREPKNHFDGYHWTFAKGAPEKGETPEMTAKREVKEETGAKGDIVGAIPGFFTGSTNDTHFFVMVATSEDDFGWETQKTGWFDIGEARRKVNQTTNKIGRNRDNDILSAMAMIIATNKIIKAHQVNPPFPGTQFDEQKHRWVQPETIRGRHGATYQVYPYQGEKKSPAGVPVPKTWTNIRIASDPKQGLQIVGRDANGVAVRKYSAEAMGAGKAEKNSRLKDFTKYLPIIEKGIKRDFAANDEAAVLYMIRKTGFRIGDPGTEVKGVPTFGASTLRCHHVKTDSSGNLTFAFVGKKGVPLRKELADKMLANRIGKSCKSDPDKPIFNTNDNRVRNYLKKLTNKPFLVKDFRTYVATTSAFDLIKTMPIPQTEKEEKKAQMEIATKVSEILGNTPKVALDSYILPEVWDQWKEKKGMLQKSEESFESWITHTSYDVETNWEKSTDNDTEDE